MSTTIAAPPRDDRAAVDKAISLLTAFGEQGSTGVGVSELARRARLSKSTAFRVLAHLERNEMVERVGTRYRLGTTLHRIGRAAYLSEHERVRDAMLPYLADLFEITRHTVHLAVLQGTDVVYLAKLYGHRSVPSPSRIGGRLPAHCTAVGKALLAYQPFAAAEAAAAPLNARTSGTITDPHRLTAELARIREQGVSYDHQESQPGLACLAVPVFDARNRAVAALSVAGPSGGLDTRAIEPVLRRVCAAATQRFARLDAPRPVPDDSFR
ncbi:transcriptional regulator, IclR family [Nocardia nova SH22a]|uniref:Transcriptional regulator, IclR family n=1 Tax=Nocardia nova SH22a TaxID=1415166 RepID=W5TEV8_9NOCA|nr:IclR family transcriptional regulator [Nocardia nova]AHH17699.1 transcriptional regulator, IclR family [Nocardia nova SH22a]